MMQFRHISICGAIRTSGSVAHGGEGLEWNKELRLRVLMTMEEAPSC